MTVVLKRGMAAGYAGIENPLFYRPNTRMLFGDAKSSLEALVERLKRADPATQQVALAPAKEPA
jgi:NAD(P) transhydrogenase subunit beta